MFETLLWVTAIVLTGATIYAYWRSRDVFHPLVFLSPMFLFLYMWMPLRLHGADALSTYFDQAQLAKVQWLNLAGLLAFLGGCLSVRWPYRLLLPIPRISPRGVRRLTLGAMIVGGLGLSAWLAAVVNVGGIYEAFSRPYSGGWDDSGYVRDGGILLLDGALLVMGAMSQGRPRFHQFCLLILFVVPWLIQAILTSRRGPTFALFMILLVGWYVQRRKRPPLIGLGLAGMAVGYLILFLVANRQSIYLGSEFEITTDVSSTVESPHTGNEYIYGAGSILSAERRGSFYWGHRYAAQVLVRPIPTSVWPNKYVDFGVPELLFNAGTGEGIADTMGWVGAVGAAPGVVADLFIEFSWASIVAMGLLGWCYGAVWRKAVCQGKAWSAQYAILSALSIYLVMQTMEAVIFRSLLLSVPMWATWVWAARAPYSRSVHPAAARKELLWVTQ